MTALWAILTELLAPLWPYLAGAGVIVAGWFAARRSGAKAQKAKTDAAQAKATIDTTQKVLHETVSADPADDIRKRMRDRAGKP